MAQKILQVEITLNESAPRIWRRLLISSDFLLEDFHKVIQTTMGWTNSHLHQFVKNETYYRLRLPDNNSWEEGPDMVDYHKIKLSDLLKKEKDLIIYEYDFGDSWCHDIVLEKIFTTDETSVPLMCLTGMMNCPPEACGGIMGYLNILEILKQPDHEEYESYMEWLGENFDPEYFDSEYVNRMLETKEYGCIGD